MPLPRPVPSRAFGRGASPLPPGYNLDRTDPDVLTLRSPEGAVVARFSAFGYSAEVVEREAWEDHRQRNGYLPPTPLQSRD